MIECEATLDACDAAIQRANDLIKSQQYLCDETRKGLEAAEARARKLEEQRDSLWRNPLVWGLVGVVIGVGGGVYLSR